MEIRDIPFFFLLSFQLARKCLLRRLPIDKSEDFKVLGVHIDDDLDFRKHKSEVCIKTSQKVGILSRLEKFNTMKG